MLTVQKKFLLTVQLVIMACMCFESACGISGCRINVTRQSSFQDFVSSCLWITISMLLTVYVLLPTNLPLLFLVCVLVIGLTVYQLVPRTECVVAVSGIGIHITKSFGPLTWRSVFVPQTSSQDVIIFEAVSKYQVDFTVGLYLKSCPNSSICNDILVPLIKTSHSTSLKDIQVAYKHLKETIDNRTREPCS